MFPREEDQRFWRQPKAVDHPRITLYPEWYAEIERLNHRQLPKHIKKQEQTMRVKIDGTEYDLNVKEKPSREDAEEAIKELEQLVGDQPAFKLLMDYVKKMALSLVVLGAMSEDQAKQEDSIVFEFAKELAAKPYPGRAGYPSRQC
jgi:hypothetical protein